MYGLCGEGRREKMAKESDDNDLTWAAQLESTTYSGPARRLWRGPLFNFCPQDDRNAQQLVGACHIDGIDADSGGGG